MNKLRDFLTAVFVGLALVSCIQQKSADAQLKRYGQESRLLRLRPRTIVGLQRHWQRCAQDGRIELFCGAAGCRVCTHQEFYAAQEFQAISGAK